MSAFGELTIGACVILAIVGMFLLLSAKPSEGPLSRPRLFAGLGLLLAAVATVVLVLRR